MLDASGLGVKQVLFSGVPFPLPDSRIITPKSQPQRDVVITVSHHLKCLGEIASRSGHDRVSSPLPLPSRPKRPTSIIVSRRPVRVWTPGGWPLPGPRETLYREPSS